MTQFYVSICVFSAMAEKNGHSKTFTYCLWKAGVMLKKISYGQNYFALECE